MEVVIAAFGSMARPEASKPAVAMRFNTGSCPHGNVEGAIIQFEIVHLEDSLEDMGQILQFHHGNLKKVG